MNEILKVKNISYDRYEELILKRDAVKKEAFIYEQEYIRKFGDLILEIYEMKLECIRKKKTIEFCQAKANHGLDVDQAMLQNYLEEELAEYQEHFNAMIQEKEAAENSGEITEFELLNIKKIYHKLVKKIHPDINPMVEKSIPLKELWQRVVVAYNCNDINLMQETEVLISKALEQLGNEKIEIEIPDIDEKIADLEEEISKICGTDPYQYKFLLDDEAAVSEKKKSLLEEKKSYEEYSNQLEEILSALLQSGVKLTWQMN